MNSINNLTDMEAVSLSFQEFGIKSSLCYYRIEKKKNSFQTLTIKK